MAGLLNLRHLKPKLSFSVRHPLTVVEMLNTVQDSSVLANAIQLKYVLALEGSLDVPQKIWARSVQPF